MRLEQLSRLLQPVLRVRFKNTPLNWTDTEKRIKLNSAIFSCEKQWLHLGSTLPEARLMTTKFVRDLMHIGVVTCSADTPFLKAIQMLSSKKLESLIVLDQTNRAIGVLGKPQVIEAYTRVGANPTHLKKLTAIDVMRPKIPEIPPHIPAVTAAQIMLDQSLREMYIMHHQDSGFPDRTVGVLSLDDVVRYLAEQDGE